jgi:PST family polysaccharide transporter
LLSVGFRAISALVVGKGIALFWGPAGTVFFGQAMNLWAVFSSICIDGLGKGLVKYGAAEKENHPKQTWIGLSLLGFLLLMAACFGLGIFLDFFSDFLAPWGKTENLTGLFFCFGFLGISYLLNHFFLLWQKNQFQAAAISFSSLGGMLGTFFAIWQEFSAGFMVYSFLVGQSLFGIASFLIFKSKIPLHFVFEKLPFREFGLLMVFGLSLAFNGFLTQALVFSWTQWAISTLGPELMGIQMAMNRLSDFISIPLLAVSQSIMMPQLASKIHEPIVFKNLIKPYFQQVFQGIFILLALLFFFYQPLLHFLFSEEYEAPKPWIIWQLAGDLFKCSSYSFAILLLVFGKLRLYFFLELGSVLVLMVGSLFLLPYFGPLGLFIVHFFRFFFYWVVMAWLYRKFLF